MANMNRIILAGNLTRDPETTTTSTGVSVTQFGLAVNRVRSRNDAVDFFDVTAWREGGETIAKYLQKGSPILIEGHMEYQSWKAQDGTSRSRHVVVVDQFQFLPHGKDRSRNANGNGSRNSSNRSRATQPANNPNADAFNEEDFDDIPF